MKKSEQILSDLKEIRELLKSFGLTWSRVYTEKRSFGYRCKLYIIGGKPVDGVINSELLIGVLKNLDNIVQLKHFWCFCDIKNTSQKYASKVGNLDLSIYYYNLAY